MVMSEEEETYAISIPTAVIAGAGGVGLGLLALKKPRTIPVLGSISPAVLGTGIAAILGFAGYGIAAHYGRGRPDYKSAGKALLYAGVASTGAFAAAVTASKYVESQTGAKQTASFGEAGYELEQSYEGGGGVPEPRVLGQQGFSEFTGPSKPGLSPTYYVTVLD